jgi:hypothetical protein
MIRKVDIPCWICMGFPGASRCRGNLIGRPRQPDRGIRITMRGRSTMKANRLMTLLGIAGLVIGGVFFASSASADPDGEQVRPAVAGFQFASYLNNRCLTVAHFNTGNGAAVSMYACSGAISQRWTLSGSGEFRSDLNNKCLEVSFANGGNGALVQMYDCLGVDQQRWYGSGSQLRSLHNNKCLTIANSNGGNGAAVVMLDCDGTAANQRWYGA